MITQDRVRELFDYRDGVLIWKVRLSNMVAGRVAGGVDGNGYTLIGVDGKRYRSHRLIWLYHHGYMPEHDIDHVNRNPGDNRIENLREVGDVCNQRNTGNFATNTSGVKGVCWFAQRGKWLAKIVVSGKHRYLGVHADFLEAVCHRLAAEQAIDWSGCDGCSPAFKYVRSHISEVTP